MGGSVTQKKVSNLKVKKTVEHMAKSHSLSLVYSISAVTINCSTRLIALSLNAYRVIPCATFIGSIIIEFFPLLL